MPSTAPFRGHVVAKAGAWTQGPALLEALRILEPLADEDLDPGTESGAHTILETLKLALADRDAHLGDGAPVDELLSASFAAERRALIGEQASHEWRPGSIAGREPFRPPLRTDPDVVSGAGEPTVSAGGETRGDTCHIDVVDRWGNIIAVTPSGGWLQSSPTVPELGFCLGTRLQMTWLDPESPSALRPGARPRTTLTPTLVLRDGRAMMALGTPGGDQQEQWQLPALLRMLVGGYTAAAGDRCADAALDRARRLVLAAHLASVRGVRRGPARRRPSSPGWSVAATPSPVRAIGPSAGSARSASTTSAARSGLRRTPAACRVTPRGADASSPRRGVPGRRRSRRRGACGP